MADEVNKLGDLLQEILVLQSLPDPEQEFHEQQEHAAREAAEALTRWQRVHRLQQAKDKQEAYAVWQRKRAIEDELMMEWNQDGEDRLALYEQRKASVSQKSADLVIELAVRAGVPENGPSPARDGSQGREKCIVNLIAAVAVKLTPEGLRQLPGRIADLQKTEVDKAGLQKPPSDRQHDAQISSSSDSTAATLTNSERPSPETPATDHSQNQATGSQGKKRSAASQNDEDTKKKKPRKVPPRKSWTLTSYTGPRSTAVDEIEFEEVYQGGHPAIPHWIVRTVDPDVFHIFRCDEHGITFGKNPTHGGARHLRSSCSGHDLNGTHQEAYNVLSIRVLNCNVELQTKNNDRMSEMLQQGFITHNAGSRRAHDLQQLYASKRKGNTVPLGDIDAIEVPVIEDLGEEIGEEFINHGPKPRQRLNRNHADNIVVGQVYQGWHVHAWRPVLALPVGPLEEIGLTGKLEDTGIMRDLPQWAKFDPMQNSFYKVDSGTRLFPVMHFDGKPSFPIDSTISLLEIENLQPFDRHASDLNRDLFAQEALKYLEGRDLRNGATGLPHVTDVPDVPNHTGGTEAPAFQDEGLRSTVETAHGQTSETFQHDTEDKSPRTVPGIEPVHGEDNHQHGFNIMASEFTAEVTTGTERECPTPQNLVAMPQDHDARAMPPPPAAEKEATEQQTQPSTSLQQQPERTQVTEAGQTIRNLRQYTTTVNVSSDSDSDSDSVARTSSYPASPLSTTRNLSALQAQAFSGNMPPTSHQHRARAFTSPDEEESITVRSTAASMSPRMNSGTMNPEDIHLHRRTPQKPRGFHAIKSGYTFPKPPPHSKPITGRSSSNEYLRRSNSSEGRLLATSGNNNPRPPYQSGRKSDLKFGAKHDWS